MIFFKKSSNSDDFEMLLNGDSNENLRHELKNLNDGDEIKIILEESNNVDGYKSKTNIIFIGYHTLDSDNYANYDDNDAIFSEEELSELKLINTFRVFGEEKKLADGVLIKYSIKAIITLNNEYNTSEITYFNSKYSNIVTNEQKNINLEIEWIVDNLMENIECLLSLYSKEVKDVYMNYYINPKKNEDTKKKIKDTTKKIIDRGFSSLSNDLYQSRVEAEIEHLINYGCHPWD